MKHVSPIINLVEALSLFGAGRLTREYREVKIMSGMSADMFWRLVKRSKEHYGNNTKEAAKWLTVQLAKELPEDIIKFEYILSAYLQIADKYGLVTAISMVRNGCSDDSFYYFRGWLIAQGKETYLRVLRNPDSLADLLCENDACSCEDFCYIGVYSYGQKTGRDIYEDLDEDIQNQVFQDLLKEVEYSPFIEYPMTGSTSRSAFPHLAARFGEASGWSDYLFEIRVLLKEGEEQVRCLKNEISGSDIEELRKKYRIRAKEIIQNIQIRVKAKIQDPDQGYNPCDYFEHWNGWLSNDPYRIAWICENEGFTVTGYFPVDPATNDKGADIGVSAEYDNGKQFWSYFDSSEVNDMVKRNSDLNEYSKEERMSGAYQKLKAFLDRECLPVELDMKRYGCNNGCLNLYIQDIPVKGNQDVIDRLGRLHGFTGRKVKKCIGDRDIFVYHGFFSVQPDGRIGK